MRKALDETKPQAVAVPGWAYTEALSALSWCVQTQTPAIMMSESTEWDERRAPWKEWMKRRLVGVCSAALVGGSPHKNYMVRLGMSPERVFLGYDAVDNGYFERKAEIQRTEMLKVENRHKYGLPDKYFLASARFVEKKNLSRLLQAYARYRQLAAEAENRNQRSEIRNQNSDLRPPTPVLRPPTSDLWHLVLLGDGPLKPDLCRLISGLGLQHFVLLPGFKQYDELPVYYGLASAFVHASTTEQWGLVMNEAMASGLPVLVSNRCGCAMDLVQEGKNGFTFDPYNVEQLAGLMFKMSAFQPSELSAFGSASREIISNWGPERFASGLQQAVQTVLHLPPPRPSVIDRLLLRLLLFR
jgi:glycosyltransferase involved in cell wall biosynthesis